MWPPNYRGMVVTTLSSCLGNISSMGMINRENGSRGGGKKGDIEQIRRDLVA